VVQRALVRSGADLIYSQGFNPHPRLSLPLPKSVGLASDDDLFCAQVSYRPAGQSDELFKRIAAQLPEGFFLTELMVHDGKVSYKPLEAEYLISVNSRQELEEVSAQAEKLNSLISAGEKIIIERRLDEKGSVKTVDVGGFLKSFEQINEGIRVICKISDKGTIRLDEIMRLLGLAPERIGVSMTRKKVNWQIN
jgi:radical SAM-linked protein